MAVALAVAGALLSIVHSFTGSPGLAMVVAALTAVASGVIVARPELASKMGIGLAAVASASNGFIFAAVGLVFYGVLTHRARSRPRGLVAVGPSDSPIPLQPGETRRRPGGYLHTDAGSCLPSGEPVAPPGAQVPLGA